MLSLGGNHVQIAHKWSKFSTIFEIIMIKWDETLFKPAHNINKIIN